MRTRLLETKDACTHVVVDEVQVAEVGERHVVLSSVARKRVGWMLPMDFPNRAELAAPPVTAAGCVRIDVVADNVLRFRYAEAPAVPDNETPMVVGAPAPPTAVSIESSGTTVVVRTPALTATITLCPYRVDVVDAAGRRVCGVAGVEKNAMWKGDAFGTGLAHIDDGGMPLATECFDLAADESIYGFGEKFIKLDKTGQTLDLWMQDGYGVATHRSYKNVPFFVSSKGYGVYLNHSSLITAWVGSRSAADLQIALVDDFLDYDVIVGDIPTVLAAYTDITGKAAVPPKWSFGYWQSKLTYHSAAETLEIARALRENDVPCDVIHIDTHWFKDDFVCDLEFDDERFADPKAYTDELRSLGLHLSLWQLPYLPPGTALYERIAAVDGFVRSAGHTSGGGGVEPWGGGYGVIDFTNPAAVAVWQEALRKLFRLGVAVIKTDFGEGAPESGVYADGTPGHRAHNLYPLLYNQAAFEATQEVRGPDEGIVWARSAWAGNQRYPVPWGGDNMPHPAFQAPQVVGGLSLGLSGCTFWSQDIGGFSGELVDEELLVRWFQWSMFLSHTRIHGFGDRELYRFSPETLRVCRDYLHLRYRLLPYIYGSAIDSAARSLPMARALVVEHQDDPAVRGIGDEWLFGDSLLVAPVFDGDARDVYLPDGRWRSWWTGEPAPGRQWRRVARDAERLPLYVREGAIVPMGPKMLWVGQVPTERLTVRIAPFETDGRSTFAASVDGGLVRIDYEAAGGRHVVGVPAAADVSIEVDVMGGDVDVTLERT
jgi:alpha-D-xyloside xylohydrolase